MKRTASLLSFIIVIHPAYSKIPSFVGDLVARDLVWVGPAGHVGIATAPHYTMRPTLVLEAMDTAPHIQQNTVADFKSRTQYWGSKGGLVSPQSIESYTVANRIIKQYYACPQYSYTWQWKEGQIDGKSRPISCALFRCDTLVNYAYAFSEGYSLPTYNTTWTSPVAIYNYFPVESDLFLPENHDDFSHQEKIYKEINFLNSSNIANLTPGEFYHILQNAGHLSKEQLSNLWEMFTTNDVNLEVKILFYDFIVFEDINFLIKKIIHQAKNESGKLRHKLLVLIEAIYQNKLKNQDNEFIEDIVKFFEEIQHQDLDKDDGGIVYRALATLTSQSFNADNIKLTNMDKIHVSIFSMENNRDSESKHVKEIIHQLNNPDDSLVVTATYQYLTQLLINSNLKFFSNNSKDLLRKHLERNPLWKNDEALTYTSSYIEFKAALNAKNVDEIPHLIQEHIASLGITNPNPILYGLSDLTKNKFNLPN